MKSATALPIQSLQNPPRLGNLVEKSNTSKPPASGLNSPKRNPDFLPSPTPKPWMSPSVTAGLTGQKASFDGQYWLQKFTPRRPKSLWSKTNCRKAETLIAAGKMQPAGTEAN